MAIPIINVSTLNGSNGFRLDGELLFAHFSGESVSSAGDINGDGFDDVMIGAPYEYRHYLLDGLSYVVFGKASGFDAVMNLSNVDGFRLRDSSAASAFLVSDAGDINGDGFDDVIIGAQGSDDFYPPYTRDPGAAYVVFGRTSGFDAEINLATLDGSQGFRLDVAGSIYVSVSSAGDVNGDGFDDVIVGANSAGYVVFGQAAGFAASLDLSTLDGRNGFRLDGVAVNRVSEESVSSAGDINGDGFDDLIVSARDSGFGYVVFGKSSNFEATVDLSSLDGSNGFHLIHLENNPFRTSVNSAGDVNGDGFDDVIIGDMFADLNGESSGSSFVVFGKASDFSATFDLSGLDGNNGFRLVGNAPYDHVGGSVSGAGDVNGDGFDDVIVNAADSCYVVFGKASGFDAVMNLSSLDDNSGFRLDGMNRASASSVSSAGDVNGDGFDDLIIGDPSAIVKNEGNYGASYVVFGKSDFAGDVIRGTPGDDTLTGTSSTERFEAGDGNDRMIGRGGADVFLGEAGNDYIRVSDLGFRLVDGGIGNDTLALSGSDLNLNLTDMAGKISGIETIRLFGTGDNTLMLTAADVLNLSDTTNTLKVNGNAGDRIVGLSHGWGDGGVHGDFHTYFNDAAVLLVGVNVATDFA